MSTTELCSIRAQAFLFFLKLLRQLLYAARAEILVDYLHYRVAHTSNNLAEWIMGRGPS